jgi:hypothetical protein
MMTPEECYALNQGLHLSQETEFLIMSIHSYIPIRRELRLARSDA